MPELPVVVRVRFPCFVLGRVAPGPNQMLVERPRTSEGFRRCACLEPGSLDRVFRRTAAPPEPFVVGRSFRSFFRGFFEVRLGGALVHSSASPPQRCGKIHRVEAHQSEGPWCLWVCVNACVCSVCVLRAGGAECGGKNGVVYMECAVRAGKV